MRNILRLGLRAVPGPLHRPHVARRAALPAAAAHAAARRVGRHVGAPARAHLLLAGPLAQHADLVAASGRVGRRVDRALPQPSPPAVCRRRRRGRRDHRRKRRPAHNRRVLQARGARHALAVRDQRLRECGAPCALSNARVRARVPNPKQL